MRYPSGNASLVQYTPPSLAKSQNTRLGVAMYLVAETEAIQFVIANLHLVQNKCLTRIVLKK